MGKGEKYICKELFMFLCLNSLTCVIGGGEGLPFSATGKNSMEVGHCVKELKESIETS